MAKLLDVAGKTFNNWTAIKRNEKGLWICRCACGEIGQVPVTFLRKGKSTRCRKCAAVANRGNANASRKSALLRNKGRPVLHGAIEYGQASSCKRRAEADGVPFGFSTLSECAKWIMDNTPIYCPVFGRELNRGKGRNGFRHWQPSIDRKVPALGYTPENMQIISMKANAMKNDATAAELKQFADWVLRGC